MSTLKIKADKREILGRKVKTLRSKNLLPGNIYGNKVKSQAVSVDLAEFSKIYEQAGETSIVEVSMGKDKRSVLIHNVQTDPVTDNFIHVDFRQVDLKQKVTASVPIEEIGESPADKQGLGTVVRYFNEIEVEALPMDLPEKFEVDLSVLDEVDKAIMVSNLKFDKAKVNLQIDKKTILFKVEPLRAEEEELPPPVTEEVEETEVEGEEGEVKEGAEETTDKPAEKEEKKEGQKSAEEKKST